MANNSIRSCWVCGTIYNYCEKCRQIGSWKAIACSPKHFQIDTIIRELREGIINKDTAKQMFENIGIKSKSDCEGILPSVVRDIMTIIEEDKVVKSENKRDINNINIKVTDDKTETSTIDTNKKTTKKNK